MNKEIKPKGFIISNQCIQCGLCQKNCPQQCISNYQIQQFDTPENIIKYPANNFVKNSFLKTSPNLDNNFLYNFLPK
ncbi:MAG: 4Fe-4S binding protein [Faecalibacillus faecis]